MSVVICFGKVIMFLLLWRCSTIAQTLHEIWQYHGFWWLVNPMISTLNYANRTRWNLAYVVVNEPTTTYKVTTIPNPRGCWVHSAYFQIWIDNYPLLFISLEMIFFFLEKFRHFLTKKLSVNSISFAIFFVKFL